MWRCSALLAGELTLLRANTGWGLKQQTAEGTTSAWWPACLPAFYPSHHFELAASTAQEDFQPMVTGHKGFQWRPERPNATSFVEQKWGWTGMAVGEPCPQRWVVAMLGA